MFKIKNKTVILIPDRREQLLLPLLWIRITLMRIRILLVRYFDADPDPAYYFDADPDPYFRCDLDTDPAYPFDADPALLL
jgi:hypothetical protein